MRAISVRILPPISTATAPRAQRLESDSAGKALRRTPISRRDMSSTFIAKGADGYDQYMGRWSKRLAPLFLDFAGIADGERIIDVGCGTGSLTFLIPDRADIAAIEAIDFE